jgi:hypothetical protein
MPPLIDSGYRNRLTCRAQSDRFRSCLDMSCWVGPSLFGKSPWEFKH